MSKIDLDTITSGYNLSKINANFQRVEDELNNRVLYRDSPVGEPNSMSSNLDMNRRSILNASKISSNVLELGGVQVVPTDLAIDPYNGTREALRRSYAEAGYTLVAGSFEAGGTVTSASDVLLHETSGWAYSRIDAMPFTAEPGSTPDSNWFSRAGDTLSNALAQPDGAGLVGTCPDIATLRTIEPTRNKQQINLDGYHASHPGIGSRRFICLFSDTTSADDGVNIFVTPSGRRWRALGSHTDLSVEYGGMAPGASAVENSLAYDRLIACLPYEGGQLRFDGTYNVKYGLLCPPRVTLLGTGMDSCVINKTGNNIKVVPDRLWQGALHSFSKDFIAAIDMDSDTDGDLSGTQTRSGRIIGMSLIGGAVAKNEYGIYSAISYDNRIEDVYIRHIMTGYRTSDSWLQTVSNVTIQDVQDGYVVNTGGTTFNLSNVYIRDCTRWAYLFNNVTYSTLTCCAADFVTGSAYVFLGCTAITMNGCGAESITGSAFEVNQSRIVINGFRGVNFVDNGAPALIFTQSGITFNNCFFPEFKSGFTSKFWQVGDTTVNLLNTIAPDASRVLWGANASWFNYMQFNGVFTIWGTNAWTATGYLINGINHIYGVVAPDPSVTQFGVGARWELTVPTAGNPYKWVYMGNGVWKVAGSVEP